MPGPGTVKWKFRTSIHIRHLIRLYHTYCGLTSVFMEFHCQGRLFVTALSQFGEALSTLYAASCDRAVARRALKARGPLLKADTSGSLQADQWPPPTSSDGCLPLEAAPSKLMAESTQQADLRPHPPACNDDSPLPLSACTENPLQLPAPTPSPSLSDIKRELRRRSGKSWVDHLRSMWEANCSCRAAGYPETSLEELNQTWSDSSICSGLPSPMDVPNRSQAAARESAAEMLWALRQLAGLLWPEQPVAAAASSGMGDPASYADWEMLQADLLSSPPSQADPSATGCIWGEALWCFNPACTNLEGPSELALKTLPCSGGCGVRYCSPECQAQGWRDGHRLSCGRLRDKRATALSAAEV